MDAVQIKREVEASAGMYVLRACCGKQIGEVITRDEVDAMNPANVIALVKQEKLRPFFAAPIKDGEGRTVTRHAIHRGCGKYDVIEGVKLNDEQLSKEEAEAMVGQAVTLTN